MGTNSINPNMLTGPVYGLATALPARKLSGTEAAVADALRATSRATEKRAVLEFQRECIGAVCGSTRRAEGPLARSGPDTCR
jgi:hypothetical protein